MTVFADSLRREFQRAGCGFNEIRMDVSGWLPGGPLGLALGALCRYLAYPLKVRWRRTTGVVFVADTADAAVFNLLPRSVRRVIFLHGLAYHQDQARYGIRVDVKDRLIYWASRLFKRRGLERCDLVLANSERNRADFARVIGIRPGQRVEVVPLGVSEHFRPGDDGGLRKQLVPQAGKVILSVAAPDLRKNLETLTGALATLFARHPDWYWVHVGGLHSRVAQSLDDGVRARAVTVDRVAHEDMPRYYAMADVFVLPTRYDTFGWPPLEAAACGCPVLVSDIAPLNRHLADVAVLLDPEDGDAWAAAIERVLTDPELAAAMAAKGLRIGERFSWALTARRIRGAIGTLGGGSA